MTSLNFEQTYVNYPFAPLVSLALKLSAYLAGSNADKDTVADLPSGMAHSA